MGKLASQKDRPLLRWAGERASIFVRMAVKVVSRWSYDTECNVRRAGHCMARLQKIVDEAGRNRLP